MCKSMSNFESPRILVLAGTVPPPYVGGAERTMVQIYQAIEANNVGQVVGLVGFRHDAPIDGSQNPFESVTVRVRIWNLYPPSSAKPHKPLARRLWQLFALINPMTMWQVYRSLGRTKPDVLVCHNLWGWGIAPWLVARLTKTPLVQVVHDYQYACFRGTLWIESHGRCETVCRSCLPRLAVSRSVWPKSGVSVFVSNYLRDTMTSLGVFNKDKSYVSFPPRPQYLSPSPGNPEFKFGFIGRLEPEKGIEDFLYATRKLGLPALVAGVGSEGYVSTLDMSHVDYRGQMSTQEFMDLVQIVVIPSLWPEPFGRVALEAAATGRFAVVAHVGGLPEAFSDNGGRGLLYDDLTPEGLLAAMARALQQVELGNVAHHAVIEDKLEPWQIVGQAVSQALS
jgi:glycosyltransferase involved in cell wall biosynthesis